MDEISSGEQKTQVKCVTNTKHCNIVAAFLYLQTITYEIQKYY